MTENEKIIATAYTGYMFVNDFSKVHKYIEQKLGRAVYTHEMANEQTKDEIHKAVRPDFMSMIKGELDGNEKEPTEGGERRNGTPTSRKRNSQTKTL